MYIDVPKLWLFQYFRAWHCHFYIYCLNIFVAYTQQIKIDWSICNWKQVRKIFKPAGFEPASTACRVATLPTITDCQQQLQIDQSIFIYWVYATNMFKQLKFIPGSITFIY